VLFRIAAMKIGMHPLQRERLKKTCFRGEAKAGCFLHWRTDDEVTGALNRDLVEGITEFVRKLGRGDHREDYSLTIECDEDVGWSSTIPREVAEAAGVKLAYRDLNKRAKALFVEDLDYPAPLTREVTLVVTVHVRDFPNAPDAPFKAINVFVESMYPGPDVGPLDGDMTEREGVVFLDWEAVGE
jgi:hypothetical protein